MEEVIYIIIIEIEWRYQYLVFHWYLLLLILFYEITTVPSDTKLAALVVAAKYAAAHKGVFLTREKKHLKALGFSGEKLAELNFISGLMGAFNQNFVHLLSEGAELEDMIKPFSPFAATVYN